MAGKIGLVYHKKDRELAIHQEGVDIDSMAIGRIIDVAEIVDERKTRPGLSRNIKMVRALGSEGKTIAWFWAQDIESLEVIE